MDTGNTALKKALESAHPIKKDRTSKNPIFGSGLDWVGRGAERLAKALVSPSSVGFAWAADNLKFLFIHTLLYQKHVS